LAASPAIVTRFGQVSLKENQRRTGTDYLHPERLSLPQTLTILKARFTQHQTLVSHSQYCSNHSESPDLMQFMQIKCE
jgi:hypothetical protein